MDVFIVLWSWSKKVAWSSINYSEWFLSGLRVWVHYLVVTPTQKKIILLICINFKQVGTSSKKFAWIGMHQFGPIWTSLDQSGKTQVRDKSRTIWEQVSWKLVGIKFAMLEMVLKRSQKGLSISNPKVQIMS